MQSLYQGLQKLVGGRGLPVHPETGPASEPLSLGVSDPTSNHLQARAHAPGCPFAEP